MTKHLLFRGFAAVGAFVFVAMLAVTAVAQAAPPQVVQGTDGALYLLQGGKAWTLVPSQISDDAVAGLNLSGEIDGTIPADLFSVPAPAAPAAPAPPAPQAQIRVDVNKELNVVSNGPCASTNVNKLIVSLASVDRQADGRSVWHVDLLNHASVPIRLVGSAAYMVAGDGTKYVALAIDYSTDVAVEERKMLDVIPQQNNIPAGVYRLFFVTDDLYFLGTGGGCQARIWSSTPISLP